MYYMSLINKKCNKIFNNEMLYNIYIINTSPQSAQIINIFNIDSKSGLKIYYSNNDIFEQKWNNTMTNQNQIEFDYKNNNDDKIFLFLAIKLKYFGFISLLNRLLFCAGYDEKYENYYIKIYDIFINSINNNKTSRDSSYYSNNHLRLLYTHYCIFKKEWTNVYNVIKKLTHVITYVFIYLKYYCNFLNCNNLLTQIILSQSKNDVILYKIGIIYMDTKQYDSALRVFHMCLNIIDYHSYDTISKLFVYKNMSYCCFKNNKIMEYLFYLKEATNVPLPNLAFSNIKYYYYDINIELFYYYYRNTEYENSFVYVTNVIDKNILRDDINIFYFLDVCLKIKKYDIYCKLLHFLYNTICEQSQNLHINSFEMELLNQNQKRLLELPTFGETT